MLPILLLAALFFVFCSNPCMDASTLSSMLASSLPSSFLDTYDLSASSLRCKDMCIVINFHVLWSICLHSSLDHFKNDSEYFARGNTQLLISLMRFLLLSLVSRSFLVRPSYSYLIFISFTRRGWIVLIPLTMAGCMGRYCYSYL